MAKSMTNLSIRVNLPDEQDYKVKEEVVILWDRVIFFVGVIVLLLALIAGGVMWYATKDGASVGVVDDTSVQAPTAQEVVKSPVLGVENAAKQESVKKQAELDSAAVSPEVGTAKAVAVSEPIKAITPAAGQPKPEATAVAPKVAAAPASVDDGPKVVTSVKDVRQSGPVAEVIKESEHLRRAVLATAMQGREPTNQASSILYAPKDQLLTVYFFTELQGLGKQEIHYEWFRNDKRAARVKVRPRYETTDNYSSKYINYNMRGNWRVTAKTATGELLASASFEVR